MSIETKVKNYFSGCSKKEISQRYRKFLKENIHINSYLKNVLAKNKNWICLKNIIYGICFDQKLKKCEECGNEMNYSHINKRFCSRKCGNSSKHRSHESYLNSSFITANPMKNEELKHKAWNTSIERYGCINKSMADFYDKMTTKWKDYIIPLFDKSEYIGKKHVYKWKCAKCGNIFKQRIYSTSFMKEVDKYLPRCSKCYPSMVGKSKPENDIFDFCKEYFPDLLEHENKNVRTFIENREIDILIPQIKLGIEFNGLKFHSVEGIKKFKKMKRGKNYFGYHLGKTKSCEEKGYRLIHIWEDEWDLNKEEIKNKLKNVFLGNEDLNFTDDIIKLDRAWYSKLQNIPGYTLKEELPPELVERRNFHVENCGYLIFEKIKNNL